MPPYFSPHTPRLQRALLIPLPPKRPLTTCGDPETSRAPPAGTAEHPEGPRHPLAAALAALGAPNRPEEGGTHPQDGPASSEGAETAASCLGARALRLTVKSACPISAGKRVRLSPSRTYMPFKIFSRNLAGVHPLFPLGWPLRSLALRLFNQALLWTPFSAPQVTKAPSGVRARGCSLATRRGGRQAPKMAMLAERECRSLREEPRRRRSGRCRWERGGSGEEPLSWGGGLGAAPCPPRRPG